MPLLLLAALCACKPAPPAEPKLPPLAQSDELVVVTRNGPTTLYVNAEGGYAGLEYDLANLFASRQHKTLRVVALPRYGDLLPAVQKQQAHLAIGIEQQAVQAPLAFGPVYQQVEPVLVGRGGPGKLADLPAASVVLAPAPYAGLVEQLRQRYPTLQWGSAPHLDGEVVMEKLADGLIDYALVDRRTAEFAQNYYPNTSILQAVDKPRSMAWLLHADANPELAAELKAFFVAIRKDGTLQRLFDRYYGHSNRLNVQDSVAFLQRRVDTLPKYRKHFMDAEARYGIDWRLLAALAYQESHWEPLATSAFGVRGLMMLTTETADNMGVGNRLDPRQSIMGGAKLLAQLKDKLPDDVDEPDRTWMALAGYNIGIAHLGDARQLARRLKRNANAWRDLKETLVLLRNPDYFATVTHGYARGGETVVFVENLRSYYDILVRFEKPYQPLYPSLQEGVVVANPENVELGIHTKLRP